MREQQLHAKSNNFKRIDIMVPPDHLRAGKRKPRPFSHERRESILGMGFSAPYFDLPLLRPGIPIKSFTPSECTPTLYVVGQNAF